MQLASQKPKFANVLGYFKKRIYVVLFFPLGISLIRVLWGDYGKTDDYVFLGLVKGDGLNSSKSLELFIQSPWNAGRWIASAIISQIYYWTPSVEQLKYWRLIGVTLLMISVAITYKLVFKVTGSKLNGFLGGMVLLSTPSLYAYLTLVGAIPYQLGILVAIWASHKCYIWAEFGNRNNLLLAWLLSLITSFIYQPLVFMLPLMSIIAYLSAKVRNKDFEKRILMASLGIPAICLLLNSIAIQTVGSSGRNSLDFPNLEKCNYILSKVVPLVLAPWLHLDIIETSRNRLVIGYALSVVFGIISALHLRNLYRAQKNSNLYRSIFHILIILGGIPITIAWTFFLEERHLDLRRYAVANIVLMFTWTFAGLNMFLNHLKRNLRTLGILALNTIVIFIFLWNIFYTAKTSNMLEREWKSFQCASAKTPLKENSKISRAKLNALLAQKTQPNEDFVTYSYQFPNPPSHMFWLSQREHWNIDYLPWNINLVDTEESVTKEGRDWITTMKNCLRN